MAEPTVGHLRAVAEEAARRAGRVLAERFTSARTIDFKGAIDLVTDADRASEAEVLAVLRGQFPGHAILAEESGASGPPGGVRWLVDPLDGTTNYAHRLPHFCVSVGAEDSSGLAVGAVYDPIRDELFSAGRGEGATLNGQPIRAPQTAAIERALLCTGFPYDVRERPEEPLALFNHFIRRAQGVRRMGSAALDLAYAACGRFDGFFELRLKPWDIAAGALLVREAGGEVSSIDGSPLVLARGAVLAAGRSLHGALRDECRACLGS